MPGTDEAYGSERCLVLTQRVALPQSGISLRALCNVRVCCYAMYGTDLANGATSLRSISLPLLALAGFTHLNPRP
eukprot:1285707-Rhodomonas_salina.1